MQYLTIISPLSRHYLAIVSSQGCLPGIISPLSHHYYLTSVSPLSLQYLTIITPGPDQHIAPVPCIIAPASRQHLTSISPVSHQYLTIPIISPVCDERLTSIISPVSHYRFASISPAPWYLTMIPVPSSLPAWRRARWGATIGSHSCAHTAVTGRRAPWPCGWS